MGKDTPPSGAHHGVQGEGRPDGWDTYATALAALSKEKRQTYEYWLAEWATDYRGEVPMRLHEKGVFGLGSSPPFAPEFNGYIGFLECSQPGCKQCHEERESRKRQKQHHRRDDSRYRTTTAFRKLRKVAPREFDVLLMRCKHMLTPSQIASRMNADNMKKDRPERYSPEAVQLLLYSGVDKVMGWW